MTPEEMYASVTIESDLEGNERVVIPLPTEATDVAELLRMVARLWDAENARRLRFGQ
jgi:hypothetical protein